MRPRLIALTVVLCACEFRGKGRIDGGELGDGVQPTDGIADDDAPIDARTEPYVVPGGFEGKVILWIAAEDALHGGNGDVMAWPDRGPSHHDLFLDATTTAPKLRRGIAGEPVVKFASSRMVANPGLFATGVTQETFAIYAVLRDDTSDNFDWVLYEGSIVGDRFSISRSYASGSTRWDMDLRGINRLTTMQQDGVPLLFTWFGDVNGGTGGTSAECTLFVNGGYEDNITPFDALPGTGMPLELGDHVGGIDSPHNPYDGFVGEIYILGTMPSAKDSARIDTYMALRYGVTLSHEYYASDNSIVRTASTTLNDRIFGLARDQASGLLVRTAASANGGDLFAIRATTLPADFAYMIAGDDNGNLTFGGTSGRLDRIWRFDTTGWIDPVTFDVAGTASGVVTKLPLAAGDTLVMLVDDDLTFTGATVVPMVEANGRWSATAAIPEGIRYVTFRKL